MRYILALLLATLLCSIMNAAVLGGETEILLQPGDRVAFASLTSAGDTVTTVYRVNFPNFKLRIRDGFPGITSTLSYRKVDGVYTFYGVYETPKEAQAQELSAHDEHKVLGWTDAGAIAAGTAIALMPAEAAGASVALASIATSIGAVVVELIPPVAVIGGLAITTYYIYKGVARWHEAVARFAWKGITLFAEEVARQWATITAAGVAVSAAYLLSERLRQMGDGECADDLEEALRGLKGLEESLDAVTGMAAIQLALQELHQNLERGNGEGPRGPKNKLTWLRTLLKRLMQSSAILGAEEAALQAAGMTSILEMLGVYEADANRRLIEGLPARIEAAKAVSPFARFFWEAFESGGWPEVTVEGLHEEIILPQVGNLPPLTSLTPEEKQLLLLGLAEGLHEQITSELDPKIKVLMQDLEGWSLAYDQNGNTVIVQSSLQAECALRRAIPLSKEELADLLLDPRTWSVGTFIEDRNGNPSIVNGGLGRQGYRRAEDYVCINAHYSAPQALLSDVASSTRQESGLVVLDVGAGVNTALVDLQTIDPSIVTIGTTVDPEAALFPANRQLFLPAEMLPEDLNEKVDLVLCSTSMRYHEFPFVSIVNMLKVLSPGGVALIADGTFGRTPSPQMAMDFETLNIALERLVQEGYLSVEKAGSGEALPISPGRGGAFRFRKLKPGWPDWLAW